jgi:hypothetical protein
MGVGQQPLGHRRTKHNFRVGVFVLVQELKLQQLGHTAIRFGFWLGNLSERMTLVRSSIVVPNLGQKEKLAGFPGQRNIVLRVRTLSSPSCFTVRQLSISKVAHYCIITWSTTTTTTKLSSPSVDSLGLAEIESYR